MAGTCGMTAGRRRSKKAGRRTRKNMKGGNGYGVVTGPEGVIAPGALAYVPNMTSTPDGKPYTPTGGRRRKSKKSKKGGRRHRKSMKGGGSVANVGYGFTGTGARGIADAIPYPSNVPPKDFPIPEGTR